jgi:hypothetical protein
VREDGRIIGGEEWQEKAYDREEWKKLLRTERNCCILHMPMECNRMYFVVAVNSHHNHQNAILSLCIISVCYKCKQSAYRNLPVVVPVHSKANHFLQIQ